jgi:hypothetical protein
MAFVRQIRALLKLIAGAGGALQKRTIMEKISFLKGRTSASPRSLKSHINAGCRQLDCAQILADGSGAGDYRIHSKTEGCIVSEGQGPQRQVYFDTLESDFRALQGKLLEGLDFRGFWSTA